MEFVKALVIALIQTAVFIAMFVWRALSLSKVRVMKLKTYVLTAPVVYNRGSPPRATITSLKPLTGSASPISSRRQHREGEKGDLLEVVPPQNYLNLPELESRLMAEARKESTKYGSPLNLSKTLIAVLALVLFTVLLVIYLTMF